MKRSEINSYMRDALEMFKKHNIPLPPFTYFTPKDWETKGHEADEIRDNMLGWDITDFGSGDFLKIGLLLVTTRNGNQLNPEKYPKTYAEKLMIVRENQITPMHFHWFKMEDIINRGGGDLVIKLYNATDDEKLADTDVTVSIDGIQKTFPAGYELRLTPGESITLTQRLFHRFWAEGGDAVITEVSMCNDDIVDNCFYDPVGLYFPELIEDEPPLYYLCNEFPKAK